MTDSILKFLKYSNFNIKKAIKYKKASEIICPDLFDSEFYAKRYNIQDDDLLLNYLFEGYKKDILLLLILTVKNTWKITQMLKNLE